MNYNSFFSACILTYTPDSNDALNGVTMVLSTESEYVTITDGTAILPFFEARQTQTIENIFAFTLNDNAPGNREIQFDTEIFIDGESVGIISFNIMVFGFALNYNEVTILNDNNGNGVLDAGENAILHIVISNVGNEPATSIMGTLSTSYPYLTINNAIGSFGNIEIDGQASADFNVTLSGNAPDTYVINLELDLIDDNNKHNNLDFKLLKGIIVFADSNVKAICVSHWDTNGDGELSYDEASSVWDLNGYFENNSEITSFDELQYFTRLRSIYYRSFVSCSALTSIVLPNSITNIDQSAFSGCSSLTSITIGNSVTSIGIYAFALCNGLTEVHYTGDIGQWCNIQFGNDINDYSSNPLKYAHNLFVDNELVTDLVIPETVTEIKRFAFNGASCLSSLSIPNTVTSIGNGAFSGCSGLTSVAIPNSVTSIGSGAFSGCSGLTSVAIPNSVTSIGSGAFSGCNGLNAVYYGGDIHQWCNIQFNGNSWSNPLSCAHNLYINNELLTDLVIPETVTEIKPNTFSGATCLTSVIISNSVTSIGNSAFAGCSGLTNLTLGNSVISIDNYAFRSCSSMTSLSIPNSVTSIGKYVFDACRDLTSLTLGNSVTSIDEFSFYNCNNLNAVYYAGDIQQWCNIQFNGNSWSNPLSCAHNLYINNDLLTDLLIPETVTEIKPCTFYDATCLTSLTIGNTVTSIGNSAFSGCSSLASVSIGNSVTSIGDYAFYRCSGLTSIEIPNSVTSIGNYAFSNCGGLTSVNLGNSVTSIGEYSFLYCTGLNYLTIGNSVASIGYGAFCQCRNLFVITSFAETPPQLDQSVFSLSNPNAVICVPCGFEGAYSSDSWGGFSNFYGMCGGTVTVVANSEEYGTVNGGGTFEAGQTCTVTAAPVEGYAVYWTLNGIVVSYNAEFTFYVSGDMTLVAHFVSEGNIVFADSNTKAICVSHWDANGDGELSYLEAASVTNLGTYFNSSNITSFDELQYFTGLTTIGDCAFSNCGSLASIVLPNSIITIGNSAFSHCYNLTDSLTIPNSVTSIGDDAFISCSGLTTLIIGNSVTTIGSRAFWLCTGLTSITFGNSVTTIGSGAFIGCSGLTTIDLPNSVTTIGSSAFKNCSGLNTIDFPNSVTTIGSFAFSYCSSLASIVLTNSVTSIGAYAFEGCDGLDAVYYIGDIHQWCSIQFDYNGSSNPLCYAHNLFIDDELVTDLVIPETVTEIKPFAFYGATCISSLTLSNSVISICESAFYNCSNLTGTLIIPNSVTTIGQRAFCYCGGFTGISIGNSVTTIGNAAFYYCTNLRGNLTIPNSVTEIGNSAFEHCMFLSSLTIGSAVTSIHSRAFYFCTSLESMIVLAETPPSLMDNYVFSYVSRSIPVYVPYGTIGAYQAATGWSQFTNFIEMDPPTNHYIPQGSAYSETMALYGVIQIDGVEQHSGLLEVGAFCGDECRGSAIASEFEITHRYLAILNIFGESGHQLTFKLYDHGLGEELELTSPAAITFDVDGYGNPIEPYVLNFTSTVAITATLDPAETGTVTGTGDYSIGDTCTLTATANEGYQFKNWTLNGEAVSTEASYSFTVSEEAAYVAHFHYVHTQALATGWNWWSTYIEQEGIDGLEMLENSIGIAGVRIQGRDGITDQFEYQGTNYWYGSLNAIANEQMYKIRTNADCNAVIVGDLASPSNHPITISNGWNWIGFPCRQSQSLDEVMSGFTPEANDVIKGRNGSSTFISYGSYNLWYGTLTVLEPGQGYMYKSNGDETKTLTFQTERCNAVGNATKEDGFFTPNTANFSSNMLVTAVVEMDGQELRSEEYELAAFVGDECRGSVRLMYVEPLDRYVAFLLVYGDEPEEVHFVLTDGNEVVCSGDCLTYAPDGIEGTPTEPVTLHFGTLSLNESGQDVVNIFPNPSDGIFSIEGKGVRKIEVVDAYGQMILSKETQNDFERIDLSDKADGLYLLRVVTSNGITTKQLIKK